MKAPLYAFDGTTNGQTDRYFTRTQWKPVHVSETVKFLNADSHLCFWFFVKGMPQIKQRFAEWTQEDK